jgi:hypothetical protein
MLTKRQLDFIDRLTPWAWIIEQWSAEKAWEFRSLPKAPGYSSILFAVQVIDASNWGTHPLAQEEYKGRPANNITLMEVNEWWDGKKVSFQGKEYKLFSSWEDFCIHFSDTVVFDKKYQSIITEKDFLNQIKLLTKDDSEYYNRLIELLKLLGIKHE